MDNKAHELYQEEIRAELIKLNQTVAQLEEITEKQLLTYQPPKDQVEVKGKIEVNTEKAVEITNLEAVRDYLGELSDNLTTAIEKSVREPVNEVTIKNIADAKSETVKVTNLGELTKQFQAIVDSIKQLPTPVVNVEKQTVDLPYSATKPLAVRLSDGKSFYNAIAQAVSAGSGMSPYKNRDNRGVPVLLEADGSVPVTIREKERLTLDIFFVRDLNAVTLAQATVVDSYTFTAVAGHNFVTGNIARFKEGNRFLRATVVNVATNVITIDQPFDYAFSTAAICSRASADMNVNGSVTPVIFEVSPAGTTLVDDINSISFEMIDDSAMDDTKFGGLNALTRGVLLRQINGIRKNLSIFKTNASFQTQGLGEYRDKSGGGQYGFNARRIFNAGEWNNCIIRLDGTTNDTLQIIIQDDLTGLVSFKAMAHAHIAVI